MKIEREDFHRLDRMDKGILINPKIWEKWQQLQADMYASFQKEKHIQAPDIALQDEQLVATYRSIYHRKGTCLRWRWDQTALRIGLEWEVPSFLMQEEGFTQYDHNYLMKRCLSLHEFLAHRKEYAVWTSEQPNRVVTLEAYLRGKREFQQIEGSLAEGAGLGFG
ncbi:hypothetical protein HB912_11625 [Listeria aquatica]|uniref:Uncharacterized protein n=1 Tax=Listeria aquatica TaxID=1494960 RepID=A0A841ZPB1_9LIST|nr:hypothetical protein [Listeria aquatica]MBC1522296.1 hypothetical protein [Listeria aquatica]